MVRIGVFSDIHSNLPALEAVLSVLKANECNQFVCCGDIIGIGPYPEQTVRRLMEIPNLTAVAGNHDRYLSEGLPEVFPNTEQMDYEEMLHHRWEHALLSNESAAFLKSLPLQTELVVEEHLICVVHYPMNGGTQYLPINPEQIYECSKGNIFLYGHDHMRSIVRREGRWMVNPGSMGCPGRDKNIARAAVLTISESEVSVDAIDIPYDASAVIQEIDRINYPSSGDIKRFFYGVQ